jgi:ketosteroid isomerase-like protein/catechol 2,3-dioxygenase-like lactoylglutathione lyase family enzyme
MSSGNADLVRGGFEAFLRGDFDALRELMAPEAQWLWYQPHPDDCHDPDKILATLRERQQEGIVTALNQVVEGGEKVFVEVTGPTLKASDLPDGQACMVVTVRDGRIVRMQDHRSRADALADAGLAPRPKPLPPAPIEHSQPGWERVSGLIPFIHVADVATSIAFYQRLGFHVTATHPEGAPQLDWAALESDQARLMFARADAPIHAREQAVMFYVYARDLFSLRERLVTDGVDAVEIVDGTPGPSAEMRLEDPDGYVLMVAQIEPGAVIGEDWRPLRRPAPPGSAPTRRRPGSSVRAPATATTSRSAASIIVRRA